MTSMDEIKSQSKRFPRRNQRLYVSNCRLILRDGFYFTQIYFTQGKLRMNKYFSGFQPRYVEGIGQVIIYTMTSLFHIVMIWHGEFPRLKSRARAKIYPDGINGYVSTTMIFCRFWMTKRVSLFHAEMASDGRFPGLKSTARTMGYLDGISGYVPVPMIVLQILKANKSLFISNGNVIRWRIS